MWMLCSSQGSSSLGDSGESSRAVGVASPDEEGAEEGEELEDIEMDPLVYDRAEFNSGEVKV